MGVRCLKKRLEDATVQASDYLSTDPEVADYLSQSDSPVSYTHLLEEQGAPSSSVDALIDNVKLEVSVTIKDKKGSLKIKGEMMGQKTDQSFDMKVDQQKKTLQSKTGEGEKVKYKVSGDVFTFDLSGEESSDHAAALEMFKNAKFKRTK